MKIALRNLFRNGIYSVVNITGMAVSLAVAILILLWVNDELNYDRFHKKGKDIYVAMVSFNLNGKDMAWKATSAPLGEYSMNEIPEIASYCRLMGHGNTTTYGYEDKETAQVRRAYVDTSFFSIFTFKLLAGNHANPFPDKDAIVLSKKAAESLFGNYEEAMDKIIREDNRTFHVSAVMENMSDNTHFRCDALCSIENVREFMGERSFSHWGSLSMQTFFLLHPGADYREVSKKISDVQEKNMPEFILTYTSNRFSKTTFTTKKTSPTPTCRHAGCFRWRYSYC